MELYTNTIDYNTMYNRVSNISENVSYCLFFWFFRVGGDAWKFFRYCDFTKSRILKCNVCCEIFYEQRIQVIEKFVISQFYSTFYF